MTYIKKRRARIDIHPYIFQTINILQVGSDFNTRLAIILQNQQYISIVVEKLSENIIQRWIIKSVSLSSRLPQEVHSEGV